MSTTGPPILRPTPRRPFDLGVRPSSTGDDSLPASTPLELPPAGSLEAPSDASFGRTRSIMNLTSSTLSGIYADRDEPSNPSTPWGTGAQTPRSRMSIDFSRRSSIDPFDSPFRHSFSLSSGLLNSLPNNMPLNMPDSLVAPPPPPPTTATFGRDEALRSVLLFVLGMGYGSLVTHLHHDLKLAPFPIRGFMKPRYDWTYLTLWGAAGVAFGTLLPLLDAFWARNATPSKPFGSSKEKSRSAVKEAAPRAESSLVADWTPVVRSIGAFVGMAFAIRKLLWTSSLQVSLTLALINPVLWYLIDRSKPGFLLALLAAVLGTAVLLPLSPDVLVVPAITAHYYSNVTQAAPTAAATMVDLWGVIATQKTAECGTWMASVLFCSCICFGNIGRRLAPRPTGSSGSFR